MNKGTYLLPYIRIFYCAIFRLFHSKKSIILQTLFEEEKSKRSLKHKRPKEGQTFTYHVFVDLYEETKYQQTLLNKLMACQE